MGEINWVARAILVEYRPRGLFLVQISRSKIRTRQTEAIFSHYNPKAVKVPVNFYLLYGPFFRRCCPRFASQQRLRRTDDNNEEENIQQDKEQTEQQEQTRQTVEYCPIVGSSGKCVSKVELRVEQETGQYRFRQGSK